VTKEEGVYNCVSRGIEEDDIMVRSVQVTVFGDYRSISLQQTTHLMEKLYRGLTLKALKFA
jgi:hypothetical protein